MEKKLLCLVTVLFLLFSGQTMAQSGNWSDASYQSTTWGGRGERMFQ